LFKYGAELPVNMSVTLPKTRQTTFEVNYEDAVPHRALKEIFFVETQPVYPKHEDFKLIVRTQIDDNHQIGIKAVELEENFIEEQKKPKENKDKKEGDPEEFEIHKVKKTHTSSVKYDVRSLQFTPDNVVADWVKVEADMVKRDNVIMETNRARNDLESLIYNCKDKLNTEWSSFITPEESKLISQRQVEVQAWMDSHSSSGKDGYLQKVNELSDLVTPVTDRQRNHAQFADSIVYFLNKIQQYSNESTEVEKNTEKYGHLTSEDKTNYISNLQKARAYYDELNAKLATADKRKDVPVLGETVYRYCNKMEDDLCRILNKPRPKEEPKKMDEEKTSQGGEQNAQGQSQKMDVEFEAK